jgi:hypothetical protein
MAQGGGEMKGLLPRQTREQFDDCPFCGEGVNVFQVPDERFHNPGWVVECKNMGCIFRRSSPDQSLAHLRSEWNKRKAAGK